MGSVDGPEVLSHPNHQSQKLKDLGCRASLFCQHSSKLTDGFGNITVLLKGLPWLLEASHFNWESVVDEENSWSIPREKKKGRRIRVAKYPPKWNRAINPWVPAEHQPKGGLGFTTSLVDFDRGGPSEVHH